MTSLTNEDVANLQDTSLSPKELFDNNRKLSKLTLQRLLKSPMQLAKSKSIEYKDLIQYADTGLWIAAQTYNGSTKFTTHAINHIRWNVLDGINIDCDQFSYNRSPIEKENKYGVVSLELEIGEEGDHDSLTLHDIIAFEDSEKPYEDTIHKELATKFLNGLTNRQKDILIMREDGFTFVEIAEKYNLHKQSVYATYNNLIKKIRENLKEGEKL